MFRDRIDAGLKLAARLKKYQHQAGLVLAVPKGGIPMAYIVAKELGCPLDIFLTKKIGHRKTRNMLLALPASQIIL